MSHRGRKIRATGPWIFIKVDPLEEKTESGRLYKPNGNMQDRMSTATGTVLSVGSGQLDENQRWVKPDLKPGQRVIFRGFLQEANRPTPFDRDHCFIHMDDILVEELESR